MRWDRGAFTRLDGGASSQLLPHATPHWGDGGDWGDFGEQGDVAVMYLSFCCHANSPALGFSQGIILMLQKGR